MDDFDFDFDAEPVSYYDRTGYCSRCDRHYGQHNAGCHLEGTTPKCMKKDS